MNEISSSKHYDLEERTYQFARRCKGFVEKLANSTANQEYGRQLIRSSGSTAANYIEANESLSKKDFCHRAKISKKEAKESRLWLRLCDVGNNESLLKEQTVLIQESTEIMKILGSIVEKSLV